MKYVIYIGNDTRKISKFREVIFENENNKKLFETHTTTRTPQ